MRPQNGRIEMYSNGFLQVVGHTPVRKTDFFRNILTVDNFSTYCDGAPIGDQRFIWVDTVTKEWGFADGNGNPEKLPDPRLDVRNYKVGDYVKFKVRWHEGSRFVFFYCVSNGHGSTSVIVITIIFNNIWLADDWHSELVHNCTWIIIRVFSHSVLSWF